MVSGRSPRLNITTYPPPSRTGYFVITAHVLQDPVSNSEIVYANTTLVQHVRLQRLLLHTPHGRTKALKIRQSPPSFVSFDCLFALHYDTCSYCVSTGLCRISNLVIRQPSQGVRSARQGSIIAPNLKRRAFYTNGLSRNKDARQLPSGATDRVEERE